MNAVPTAPSLSDLAWRKSSHSGSHGGDCVEVAASQVGLHVRDSKQPELGMLTLSRGDWASLLGAVS